MKKVLIVSMVCILVFAAASMAFAAEKSHHAFNGDNGRVFSGFGPAEGQGAAVGQTIREHVRVQNFGPEIDPESLPPEGVPEPEEGMPKQHGLTGAEFGQMIREMARSEPGAVAHYMHQWRFNYPTME